MLEEPGWDWALRERFGEGLRERDSLSIGCCQKGGYFFAGMDSVSAAEQGAASRWTPPCSQEGRLATGWCHSDLFLLPVSWSQATLPEVGVYAQQEDSMALLGARTVPRGQESFWGGGGNNSGLHTIKLASAFCLQSRSLVSLAFPVLLGAPKHSW